MRGFSFALRAAAAPALCAILWSSGGAAPAAIAPGSPASIASAQRGFDLANIDPACPACRDFQQFANGGWIARHPIPPDRARFGSFDELAQRNEEIARDILEAAAANPAATGDEKKLGDLYASCMDEETIEKAGLTTVAPLLAQIDAIHDTQSLTVELARLHAVGIRALWIAGSTIDAKNSARQLAYLGPSGLTLPDRDYYLTQDAKSRSIREKFLAHLAAVFELAGDAPAPAAAAARSVLAFETNLAQGQLDNVERRNPDAVYHLVRRAELASTAPHVPWDAYFGVRKFPPFDELDLSQPAYAKGVDALLVQTPLAELKNYLRWRVLAQTAGGLPKRFADQEFAFQQLLTGAEQRPARYRMCTRVVDTLMGDALGMLWVAKAFSPEAKSRTLTMVRNLQATLADDLKTLPWMSDATRAQAQAKLAAMFEKIGYPEHWRSYGAATIARADYLANLRSLAAFSIEEGLARIGKPVDRNRFGMTPPTVNAYYSPARNEIVFPAGILQPPFFYPQADNAINYGAIGAVIGHEMTHGFDDTGRRYDAQGNLRDWWTPQDAANFKARAQCIVDQYSAFKVDDLNVNGRLVQGEAIADLGGLVLAYRAFERSLAGKPRKSIDGYTPEQRFFLAFARSWASSTRPERLRTEILTNPHPPDNLRVIGTLSNMPEFARAFGCKAGDAMVRPAAKQCRIW